MGGSGRKRWRKRQRESRSEWHMAFRLKKEEQHKTKTRIWISQIRKSRGTRKGWRRKCRFFSASKMVEMHMLTNVL